MAAHALHLSFSLEAFTDWIVGTRDKTYDWKASWAQSTVSESKWRKLLERIAVQANNLTHAMTRHAAANPESA